MEYLKTQTVGMVIGVLLSGTVFGLFFVSPLKAKDRSVSDELYRLEARIDVNQNATLQIVNFINQSLQAQQPK